MLKLRTKKKQIPFYEGPVVSRSGDTLFSLIEECKCKKQQE